MNRSKETAAEYGAQDHLPNDGATLSMTGLKRTTFALASEMCSGVIVRSNASRAEMALTCPWTAAN